MTEKRRANANQLALNETGALVGKFNGRMFEMERELKAKSNDSTKDSEDTANEDSANEGTVSDDANKEFRM